MVSKEVTKFVKEMMYVEDRLVSLRSQPNGLDSNLAGYLCGIQCAICAIRRIYAESGELIDTDPYIESNAL